MRRDSFLETPLKSLLLGLLLFLLIKPDWFNTIQWLDSITNYSVLAVGVAYTGYGLCRRRFDFSTIALLLYFCVHLTITCFYTPNAFLGEASAWLRVVLAYCIFSDMLNSNFKEGLRVTSGVAYLVLAIDLVMGVTNYFFVYLQENIFSFLGQDIYSIFSILPLLTLIVYNSCYQNDGKIDGKSWAIVAACFLLKVLTNAATGIISLALFVVLIYLFSRGHDYSSFFNPASGILLLLLFSCMFCVFLSTDFFQGIFSIFGKDVTLSGRTYIWSATVPSIIASPWTGHGVLTSLEFVELHGFPIWELAWGHCHNAILELLFQDGLAGFLLFGLFCGSSSIWGRGENRIKGGSLHYGNPLFRNVLYAGIFAYCILSITDSYLSLTPLFLVLAALNYELHHSSICRFPRLARFCRQCSSGGQESESESVLRRSPGGENHNLRDCV